VGITPGIVLTFFDATVNLRFAADGNGRDKPAGNLGAALVIVE
jgi:hypothetical protein